MTVTQSQSKILKLKLEKVPLNQLIPEWLKPFHIVARDKQIKVKFLKEGSDLIFAYIDVVKFPWVISNLVLQ